MGSHADGLDSWFQPQGDQIPVATPHTKAERDSRAIHPTERSTEDLESKIHQKGRLLGLPALALGRGESAVVETIGIRGTGA